MLGIDHLAKMKKLMEENARKMNFNLDDAKWWWRVIPVCLDCHGFDDCPVPIEERRKRPLCEVKLYAKYHEDRTCWPEDCKRCACIGNSICCIENGKPAPEKCELNKWDKAYEQFANSIRTGKIIWEERQ